MLPSLAGIQSPKSPFLQASAPAWPQSSSAAQPERPTEWHCKIIRHNISHRDKIAIYSQARCPFRKHSSGGEGLILQTTPVWGASVAEGGKTRSFSEDVSNQLGTLAHHFHLSSIQKKMLARWALWGHRLVWGGWIVTGCNCVLCVWGGGKRGKKQSTEGDFFLCCRAFSVEALGWVTVVLSDTS